MTETCTPRKCQEKKSGDQKRGALACYLTMADIQAKIAELENEMARTQKNKATNYHLGEYWANKIGPTKEETNNRDDC